MHGYYWFLVGQQADFLDALAGYLETGMKGYLEHMRICAANVAEAIEAPHCRVCGCTEDHACDGGCYWIEEDLCSSCCDEDVLSGEKKSHFTDDDSRLLIICKLTSNNTYSLETCTENDLTPADIPLIEIDYDCTGLRAIETCFGDRFSYKFKLSNAKADRDIFLVNLRSRLANCIGESKCKLL